MVGLAWQRGLIHDVNDYVRDYMPPHVDLFESEHNQKIKWDHLLRQTSDWQGTLWGKPDWADRPVGETPDDWANRKLCEPGTHFKYNDVRVNVMALAALQVWRRPLPDVLREEVMEPIGASSTWRWYGYDNSWVDIDGKKVQSVSGGGHWGGGMFINSYDMARFGYLFLRNGKWKDRTIVSEKWIQMARTPGTDNKTYGFANWYLNTDRSRCRPRRRRRCGSSATGRTSSTSTGTTTSSRVFRWISERSGAEQGRRQADRVDEGDDEHRGAAAIGDRPGRDISRPAGHKRGISEGGASGRHVLPRRSRAADRQERRAPIARPPRAARQAGSAEAPAQSAASPAATAASIATFAGATP